MSNTVNVEMFLDVSCPWCHGALETNRRIVDEFHADPELPKLAIQWRFIRLHPMKKPGATVDEMLGAYVGFDADKLAAMKADVQDFVTSVGVRVDESKYTIGHDPIVAHRLLALVRDDSGLELPSLWSVARAVFDANFVHGVDITDPDVLRRALLDDGLILPTRIWQQLEDPKIYLAETLADRERALTINLDGVPRMYVNETIIPTWVEPLEVRSTLRNVVRG